MSPESFQPVRIRRGLTLEDVAKVEEWKLELPGVIVEVEPQRAYPTSRPFEVPPSLGTIIFRDGGSGELVETTDIDGPF